jgi:hypothetical protein
MNMLRSTLMYNLLSSLLIALLALLPGAALALVGEVTHLSGAVLAQRAEGQSRILSIRSEVREGDLVITAANAYARIRWADGGDIVLRPDSQLKVEAFRYEEGRPAGDSMLLSLIKGGMRAVTGLLARRSPASFRLATPSATIGIRGTHLGALVCNNDCDAIVTAAGGPPANGTHVDVADGAVSVTTKVATLVVKAGEFGFAASLDHPPVPSPAPLRVTLPPQASNVTIQGGTVGAAGELECRIASQ